MVTLSSLRDDVFHGRYKMSELYVTSLQYAHCLKKWLCTVCIVCTVCTVCTVSIWINVEGKGGGYFLVFFCLSVTPGILFSRSTKVRSVDRLPFSVFLRGAMKRARDAKEFLDVMSSRVLSCQFTAGRADREPLASFLGVHSSSRGGILQSFLPWSSYKCKHHIP